MLLRDMLSVLNRITKSKLCPDLFIKTSIVLHSSTGCAQMASLFKSTTTYDPIFALLNADTRDERDRLTEKWRDHKLSELNFIGVVVSTGPYAALLCK